MQRVNHKHPATDITQDSTHQFVTATKKTEWDAKADSIDTSFETVTYSATPSITFDPSRPNKKITLTGNIAITNTGTSNGSSGIYEIIQDSTPRTVSINGTSLPINTGSASSTLIGWLYDGTTYTFDVNVNSVRIGNITTSATPTPNIDIFTQYNITSLGEAAAFGVPSGTPYNGQQLLIRIKDDATARALSWNAIYRASSDFALPTTTVISKTIYIQFIYNSADTKWDAVGLTNMS